MKEPESQMDRLLLSIEAIEQHDQYLNRFTDNEEASLLSSICSLLEPKNIVEEYISLENKTLKSLWDRTDARIA